MKVADSEGIRAARTRVVKDKKDLMSSVLDLGCPCILKTDHSAGGVGVKVVTTKKAAIIALYKLRWKFVRGRLIAVLRGEISFRSFFLERMLPTVNLQEFIAGPPATTAFSCWKGKVVGAVHVEVLQEAQPRGPATVVRLLASPTMDEAARKIASRFCLSGIHGLDYVLDSATGAEILIEMNPRLTQIAHFNMGTGSDPAYGLVAAMSATNAIVRERMITSDVIALFPQEMHRDPDSRFLSTAYHDVFDVGTMQPPPPPRNAS